MKHLILSFFSILLVTSFCFAQDTLTKRSGGDIISKVLEVNQMDIKYKKYDNPDGPTFSILRKDVSMIRYSNGTMDLFGREGSYENYTKEDWYHQAQIDAKNYYKGYKGAGGGTLAASLVSPLAGLIPAIVCSTTIPKDKNLGYPSLELMQKPYYYDGYTKKAKRIKTGKVWKNWGIGFGVNLVAAILITATQGE